MYTAMNTRITRELATPTAQAELNAARTQMLEINESIQTDMGKVYRSAVRSKVWSFIAAMLGLLALGSSTVAQTSTPLTIDCPPNRTNWLCGVSSFAFVSYSLPTTAGSCSTNAVVTCTPPSGSTFILGTTTVSCRASNSCRQSATCSFNITVVRDTVPPVIQCPTNRIVWLCGTTSTARVSFTLPSAMRIAMSSSPARRRRTAPSRSAPRQWPARPRMTAPTARPARSPSPLRATPLLLSFNAGQASTSRHVPPAARWRPI